MASTAKWITNLRQSIKNTCGTGWSVRGRESKGELITQVTFRYPDNQGRTAANVNLAWNAKNTTKIITAVEQLNDLMTQKNLSLQKAVELRMEPISQNKDNNFSTWEALKEDYLNEEKKNHRATTVRDLRLRLDRFLDCFKTKPIPRDSETLFKRFYDLHLINMTSGGQGRRRNIGDIRAFLKWAVEEKGAPDRWFPINTKAANKYIGVVSKGQKKRGTTPISTRDLELLLESLEHDKEHGMRAICILSAVYGIRVSEIAHMEIKDGVVQVTTLKQNAKNMENQNVSTRVVEPLNLPNLPNEGERIISLLESKKLKFPAVINRAIDKANDEKGYKIIGEVFAKKLNRYWYWKQLKISNPDYVVYSMRHSFAWRGSMEVKPAIPYRVLSSLMGHDLQTHLKYYGGWSKEEENKNAMQIANQSVNGQLISKK